MSLILYETKWLNLLSAFLEWCFGEYGTRGQQLFFSHASTLWYFMFIHVLVYDCTHLYEFETWSWITLDDKNLKNPQELHGTSRSANHGRICETQW